jgi:flagellar protein FlaJ
MSTADRGADPLADLFYPLYKRLFGKDSDFSVRIQKSLSQSRNTSNVEMYLSRALGYGVIIGFVLTLLGVATGFALTSLGIVTEDILSIGAQIPENILPIILALKIPLFISITGLVLGSLGFGLTFGWLAFSPSMSAGARKREINVLMPDAISFMYALAAGGMNQLEIIKAIANAEDTYGEVSKEFQSVLLETQYFDTDYRNALRKQAEETPSDKFSQFLMDMLSIIASGGDIEGFLEDQKDKHMRLAKQEQELTLDTLELFGEMYMTLSLFPLLLIIILVAMSMLGNSSMTTLYGVVYGLLPIIGVGFLVLVSTIKQDEVGDGRLDVEEDNYRNSGSKNPLFDSGLIAEYQGEYNIFDQIRGEEDTYNTSELLKKPHLFFRENPLYILALTVPSSIVVLIIAVTSGAVPTSVDAIMANPVWPTFVYAYIPLYINMVPVAFFYEWNHRYRYGIVKNLSDTLRNLASANDSGQTLFEAMATVSDNSDGRLATDFDVMSAKVAYGTSIKQALTEFNNKYRIPRMARTIKLIAKAQEASGQITKVLTTAAQASENQDDIDRQRKSRARMQVVIILMTYLTLLAVMAILKTQFLEVMAQLVNSTGSSGGGGAGGSQGFGASIDVDALSMLFFHAVTLQAIMSGVISGYMRDASIVSGFKYTIILMTIALSVWVVVG